jgi:hypothetical protein
MAPNESNEGTKILHLRVRQSDPWQPYTRFPQLAVADHEIANGSKGFATFQRLLKAGWEVVPSPDANDGWGSVEPDEDLRSWGDIYGLTAN